MLATQKPAPGLPDLWWDSPWLPLQLGSNSCLENTETKFPVSMTKKLHNAKQWVKDGPFQVSVNIVLTPPWKHSTKDTLQPRWLEPRLMAMADLELPYAMHFSSFLGMVHWCPLFMLRTLNVDKTPSVLVCREMLCPPATEPYISNHHSWLLTLRDPFLHQIPPICVARINWNGGCLMSHQASDLWMVNVNT